MSVKPFLFFFFFFFPLPFHSFSPLFLNPILAVSFPPKGTHLSPPENQTNTEPLAEGDGKHTAGCSSSNTSIPSLIPPSARPHVPAHWPGFLIHPVEGPNRTQSRIFNLLSFSFWFQGAKQGSNSQGEAPPAVILYASPFLQHTLAARKPSGCCSKVSL